MSVEFSSLPPERIAADLTHAEAVVEAAAKSASLLMLADQAELRSDSDILVREVGEFLGATVALESAVVQNDRPTTTITEEAGRFLDAITLARYYSDLSVMPERAIKERWLNFDPDGKYSHVLRLVMASALTDERREELIQIHTFAPDLLFAVPEAATHYERRIR